MGNDETEFELRLSEDRMALLLDCEVPKNDAGELAVRIDAELATMGVAQPPARATLKKQLAAAAEKSPVIKGLVVARGKKPVPPKDARVKWSRDFFNAGFAVSGKSGAIDYRQRAANLAVHEGEILARVTPAEEGHSGCDVLGKEIKAPRAKPLPVKPGANVEFDEENLVFRAAAEGRVRLIGSVLSVDYIFEIPGNVGLETGNVSHPGTVVIKGDVEAGSVIEAGGDIEVHGTVEAARISAGGSITIRGGITSGQRGAINAGGSVHARFILDTSITAGEDIVVEKEIVQSTLRTRGAVLIPAGRIVGGETAALGGIVAGQAGSDGLVHTVLAPGEDRVIPGKATSKIKEIKKLRAHAKQINENVKPLMSNPKRLSAKQREAATDLLARAGELELAAQQLGAEVEKMMADSQRRRVRRAVINGPLYQETLFKIGKNELKVTQACRGPLCAVRQGGTIVLRPLTQTHKKAASGHEADG